METCARIRRESLRLRFDSQPRQDRFGALASDIDAAPPSPESTPPLEITLELQPRHRYDALDVTRAIDERHGDVLSGFRKVMYCSHHTTAGYLEQPLVARLEDRRDRLDPFIRAYQGLFPKDAGYRHDCMHLRTELSEDQRRVEPPNADAHLTFIGSGLQSCVTYIHRPGVPVYFMDLDGVFEGRRRTRRTSVIGFNGEEKVAETSFTIPMSRHAIDSVNLADERLGLMQVIREMLDAAPVDVGRVDLSLAPTERSAAVTVNEYETLLMRHDLAEVLHDPLRFMARQGLRMLDDPRSVPAKSLGYAKYDVVHVINELIDALGLGESAVERVLARVMAVPASRLLRFRRSLSLAVSRAGSERPTLVYGRYQSPILIQWESTPRQARSIQIRLSRLR